MVGLKVSIEFENLPEPHIDDEAISRWIDERLTEAQNLFLRHINRTGTGRKYRRGRRGRVHVASKAGEYPVWDQGGLGSSIHSQMNGPRQGTLYSELEYAMFLAGVDREGNPVEMKYLEPRLMLADAVREVLDSQPRGDVLARSAKVAR